jgi:hypothetical protein
MAKYSWPASGLGKDEMPRLHEASQATGKPITVLVREAVQRLLGVEEGNEEL